jgi:hypothetical protein
MTTQTQEDTMTNLTAAQKTELKALIPELANNDWLTGSAKSGTVARSWIAAGFDSVTAPMWWDAGCFSAQSAAELRDAGLLPCDAALVRVSVHGSGDAEPDTSIGFAHSNGDITTDDAVALCGGGVLMITDERHTLKSAITILERDGYSVSHYDAEDDAVIVAVDCDDADDEVSAITSLLGDAYTVSLSGEGDTDGEGYSTWDVVVALAEVS